MNRRSLLLATGLLATPMLARAQDFPVRPIRVVVPYAPGGQSDTVMRLLIPRMAEFLGQNIIVENRIGGGGVAQWCWAIRARFHPCRYWQGIR